MAMPNDVKAIVSALSLIVAAVLAYWSGSPIRPEFSTYIMVTAVFMVLAMWIFPEFERAVRLGRSIHRQPNKFGWFAAGILQ
jgi:membrane protein YdbS with pleckstrin-like domain